MAKRNNDGTFVPGVIYELGVAGDNWVPFYVGESHDANCRINGHISATKKSQTDVYIHTRSLDAAGIAWVLKVIDNYGIEGPTDKEHDHIIRNINLGFKLKNMKKGNQHWMEQMERDAADMKKLGMTSYSGYKKYVKILEDAERQKRLDERHARWAKEAAEKKRKQLLKRAAEFRAQDLAKQAAKEREAMLIARVKQTNSYQLAAGYKISSDPKAQEAFNKGRYDIALNQLGGSRRRFEDEFGISYYEAMSK